MASQITGSSEIAVHVYQALYGQAPSNPLFDSYVTQIGTSDGFAWAAQMVAGFSTVSDSNFATLVLQNMGITASTLTQSTIDPTVTPAVAYAALHDALAAYFTATGVASRGTVVVQLSEIISNLAATTDVYGAAATAYNFQAMADFTYASNPAHLVPGLPPSGQTFTLTDGIDNFTGTGGNDIFNAVYNPDTSTQPFGGLDKIDGGLGTDTMNIIQGVGYLDSTVDLTLDTTTSVKNVEIANIVATGSIVADLSKWTGLQTVNSTSAEATDGDHSSHVEIYTDSNATTVNVKVNANAHGDWNAGSVYIEDYGNNGAALANVTITDSFFENQITSNALTSLTLINDSTSGEGTHIHNDSSGNTLALNLDNANTWVTDEDSAYTTLNVNTATDSSVYLDFYAARAINFAGAGHLNALEVDDAMLTTVTVAGAGGVNADVSGEGWNTHLGYVTSVDTTASSAKNTFTIDGHTAYAGGAGVDVLTVINHAATAAIALGAGNDTLNYNAGSIGVGGSLDGGLGKDLLNMSAANADALTNSAGAAKVSGFEVLSVDKAVAVGGNTINLTNLNANNAINYVISAGSNVGAALTETDLVTFNVLHSGQSVTEAGLTVTAIGGDLSAAGVASVMISGTSNSSAFVTGALVGYTATAAGAGQVLFTSTTANTDVPDLILTASTTAAPAPTVSVVTTDGIAAVSEVDSVTFTSLLVGQTMTVAGLVVTATGTGASATDVAAAVATGATVGGAAISGALTGFTAAPTTTATVVFTATVPGVSTNITAVDAQGTSTIAPTVQPVVTQVTDGFAGTAETAVVTFSGLKDGQSDTVGGWTYTAVGDLSANQVAAAFAAHGAVTGFNETSSLNNTVTYTSTTPTGNVTNLTASSTNTAAPTLPSDVNTDGHAASGLTTTGLVSGGTLELTGAGTQTVNVLNAATGTADVLNVALHDYAAGFNFGSVTAANVETVNISTIGGNTSGATWTSLTLNAHDAKAITVSGHDGLTLTGDFTNLTTLDASGVTAGSSSDSLINLGVYFTDTGAKAITILGGDGSDIFVGSMTGASTIAGGAGNDTLTGRSGADNLSGGAGDDTLIVAKGHSTLTGGAGADTFNISAGSTSGQIFDTITDLSKTDMIYFANTVTNAGTTLGAAITGLSPTAVFQDYLDAAAAKGVGNVAWFQYAGDTYVVQDIAGMATFQNGVDNVVKLVGVVNLTTDTFAGHTVTQQV